MEELPSSALQRKTSPPFAAFVNGVSIHADDFDDTQLSAAKDRVYGLAGASNRAGVVPAILALAERPETNFRVKNSCWRNHLGAEVECKIRRKPSRRAIIRMDFTLLREPAAHSARQQACAKLFQFDLSKILNTFGLAASQSGGLRENFRHDD